MRLTIDIPESAFSTFRKSPVEFAEEMKRAAVAKWYQQGMVSQSKACEILQISREDLFRVLAAYEVDAIQVTDLASEVKLFS